MTSDDLQKLCDEAPRKWCIDYCQDPFYLAAREYMPKLIEAVKAAQFVDDNVLNWFVTDDTKAVQKAMRELSDKLAPFRGEE